jgi:hypothetical protein
MTDETPIEPAYTAEAKRAAARTGLISILVIFGIITMGIVLLAVRDFSRPGPIGLTLWVSIAAMILAWFRLFRLFRKRKRLLPGPR